MSLTLTTICPKFATVQLLVVCKINFGRRSVKITSQELSWNCFWHRNPYRDLNDFRTVISGNFEASRSIHFQRRKIDFNLSAIEKRINSIIVSGQIVL